MKPLNHFFFTWHGYYNLHSLTLEILHATTIFTFVARENFKMNPVIIGKQSNMMTKKLQT